MTVFAHRRLAIASLVVLLAAMSLFVTDWVTNSLCRESRVPVELHVIEQDYVLWKARKVLEAIKIPFFGDHINLEIVYNDRDCVEGFVKLNGFSTGIDILEARLSNQQVTVYSYRDVVWIRLSKREYSNLRGAFR